MPPQQPPVYVNEETSASPGVQFDVQDVAALPSHPPRLRSSVLRRESFIVQFSKTKGPPQITLIMLLIAVGLGSTIGVVPAVMSDRFARIQHGYDSPATCSSFEVHDKPEACFEGSADAQSAVTLANLISNGLTFLLSSLLGSLSDQHGRKGILVAGLFLGCMSPLMLVLIQIMPAMSPWWYYGCHASTGLLNWFAIALSALSDVLPPRFRAPGIGILLAGFLLGFSLAPIFALLLTPLSLSIVSLATVTLGLVSTILFVPETLPPSIAQFAKEQHRLEELRDHEWLLEQEEGLESSFWATSLFYLWFYTRPILRLVSRPFREMSILNRNTFFRLISTLAFFSGMVSSGDQVLLVYYLQERLDFTTKDVSVMFFIMGTLGLFAQGVLLKPLNDCIGEKWVVALAFFVGAVDNTMYGLATNKATIFTAVALSSITGMAFPTISAIKANNVEVTEQGRIQGALYSLQALASGLGPVLLRLVYTKFRHSSVGPGAMFIFAASLYLVAVAVAYALPADRANTQRLRSRNDGDVDHDDDIDDEGLMDFDELLSSTSSASIPEENSSVGVYGSLL